MYLSASVFAVIFILLTVWIFLKVQNRKGDLFGDLNIRYKRLLRIFQDHHLSR